MQTGFARLWQKITMVLVAVCCLGAAAWTESVVPLEHDPNLMPKRPQKPVVLQGHAVTLQEAIDTETNIDWYGWYLACRSYLQVTGGLACGEGTPIVFYKDGRMMAQTNNPYCQQSVQFKRFRLPDETRLTQLVLPVRSNIKPPATQSELYNRVKQAKETLPKI